MKKVIVFGSNGQLGKTINDLSKQETMVFRFFSKSDVNITDKNRLTEVFENSVFDYCINCAAYTNVEAAENNSNDALLINAEGAKNIAEACETHQVKLIHISTDYVFDGKKQEPYTTTDTTNPINEYGKSKLKGELYIQDQLKAHYIIRVSWLYSLHGKNFLKTIINKIDEDAVLNITTEEEGTPTNCIDLSQFIFHIINNDTLPFGIYNFSANGSTTWYGFAKEVARNYNSEKVKNIKSTPHFKTIAKRPKYSVFDLNKTERSYKKLNTWKKSVSELVEEYKIAAK